MDAILRSFLADSYNLLRNRISSLFSQYYYRLMNGTPETNVANTEAQDPRVRLGLRLRLSGAPPIRSETFGAISPKLAIVVRLGCGIIFRKPERN